MIFVETSLFTRLVMHCLSDEEYGRMQIHLLEHPDAGDVIQGSGGLRKLRWKSAGKGKRGGIRVIYYWKVSGKEIWFLTMYAKGEQESIPVHILKQIAKEFNDEK